MKCDECKNANICLDHIELPSLSGCTSGVPDHKVMTNADRIRSMNDEELAELFTKVKEDYQWIDQTYPDCEDVGAWLEWLQSPVDKVSDMENLEARR